MRTRATTRAAAIGLVALAAAFGGVPAAATVIDSGSYTDEYAFSFDDCGFDIAVEGAVTGRYRIRAGSGEDDGAFLLRETFSYRETLTNPDTGQWFVIRGSGTFNEVQATRVEDSIFEFRSIEAGQPFVVEDSSGDIVIRDRGVIRRRVLFDTGGDDQPGGTELALLDFEVGGPHPGLFVDFCQVAAELIGDRTPSATTRSRSA